MACELRKEAWKIPSANREIINKPKSFFYDSKITQILNWEQSVSKALKAATSLEYNTKSKITSWITRTPSNIQHQHQQVTNQNPTNQTTLSQQSLFTYLTRPTRKKFKPNLESISEDDIKELLRPTGKDHLIRKYNKYRKATGKYIRNNTADTETSSKYIQFRIDRYIHQNVNFQGPIN